jgi:hypothetical protein
MLTEPTTITSFFAMAQIVLPSFPQADPIPLPAPVWLFKVLGDLTLSLHFGALFMLLGGTVLGIAWNALGRGRQSAPMTAASGVLAARLPVIMTFVINLGIPPLLFTQVLYGRALYASSVLIGAFWILVVFLLMAAYFLLYRSSQRAMEERSWWLWGLMSLAFLIEIGRIYSMNMTLMLRPEDWPGLYAQGAMGNHLTPDDPTRTPRWILMMVSSLGLGILGCGLFSMKRSLSETTRLFLARHCGWISMVGLLVSALCSLWAYGVQPEAIRGRIQSSQLHHAALFAWFVGLGLAGVLGLWMFMQPGNTTGAHAILAILAGLISIGSLVVVRDGVRDFTLASKGFDVWQRDVVTNWSVVGLFLLLFVVGIGLLAWLGWVVKKAKPMDETYVSA